MANSPAIEGGACSPSPSAEQAIIYTRARVLLLHAMLAVRTTIQADALRVVKVDNSSVVDVLYQGEGNLKRTSAHIAADGGFVLDLTMITGFDRTATKMVLWTAPNTEGNRGSYARQDCTLAECTKIMEYDVRCARVCSSIFRRTVYRGSGPTNWTRNVKIAYLPALHAICMTPTSRFIEYCVFFPASFD